MACIRHNNKHKAQQKQYMRPGFPFHHVHIAIIDAKVSMLKNTKKHKKSIATIVNNYVNK